MAWHRNHGVRTGDQLSAGERAADRMRNSMGSWAFVFTSLVFLAVWMLVNRNTGFDPYPFILLNLVLSCVAALQGAILLIAAKRSDQISSELAQHDYETDCRSQELLTILQADFERLTRQHAEQSRQLAEVLTLLGARRENPAS
ncbi:DUF1003 domain-containing protein [Actinospica robiniae]|uniref:DUF1003 domain-containing protein n=1 Tax=Actinospica robiniae TaxID=304901 RepID=UPI0003F66647|nr:DUF1003 domain-containing protein [Actinospica robiniae]